MASGIQLSTQSISSPVQQSFVQGFQAAPDISFDSVLNSAMADPVAAAASGATSVAERKRFEQVANDGNQWLISQAIENITPGAPTQVPVDSVEYYYESDSPAITPENINNEGLRTSKLATTPFQFFLDKGIDFFRRTSGMERRSDQLMERYARGEVSIEELTIEKAKVGVAISFAVTLVTQVTQAFNELKNMQI
jgi:flagellar hook-basal body complex protein FliE